MLEPDLPSPEEDPKGYADYLRRKVVGAAREYIQDRRQQSDDFMVRDDTKRASIDELVQCIVDLDDWKKEFDLEDIN